MRALRFNEEDDLTSADDVTGGPGEDFLVKLLETHQLAAGRRFGPKKAYGFCPGDREA